VNLFYAATTLDLGGAERMLYETVARVRAAGHGVAVTCLLGDGPVADWLRRDGVPVYPALMRWPGDPLALPRLAALLRREKPDLLHTWLFHANLFGRVAARLAGVPHVVAGIRVYDDRAWHHRVDRLTLGLVSAVTTNSATVRDRLVREQGYPAEKITIIVNGVAQRTTPPVWPADVPRLPGTRLLVSVGRQHPQKGQDVLLRAVAELRREFPLQLVVCGRPDAATPQLLALCRELRLDDCVTFTGLRPDARELAAQADVFVLPSRWEGMPNVLLEAQADGVACVATAVDGSREVIADGDSGLLVPPDDVPALAAAIGGLLRDDARRAALGAAARARAARDFSLDVMAEKTVALYQQLVRT